MDFGHFNFSLTICCSLFAVLNQVVSSFIHLCFHVLLVLQPSVIYLSSSVCLTVLLVHLIYRLVACVMNILHIIAEFRKTEEMNSINELFHKKATEIILGNTT